MSESCCGIKFDCVLDICPERQSVLVKHSTSPWCREICLGDNFTRFKFEAIKWIKKRPCPEDRIWLFEVSDQNGITMWQVMDRLIESRKSRPEKEKERIENEYFKKLIQERDIS